MATEGSHIAKSRLEALQLWHRFHVRLTALYAGTVFLTLVVMAVLSYRVGVQAEIDGLKQRLMAVVTSLSETVSGDRVAAVPLAETNVTPLHAELLKKFGTIANSDPDIDSIYVLRPTDEPTRLRFLVDYAKDGNSGAPGEEYLASDVPVMLQGFQRPVVENKPYRDEFGLSLSGYAPVRNSEGKSVGVVGVDVLVSRIGLLKRQVLEITLYMFGIAAALIALASFFVARSIRNPLSMIIGATAAVAQGDLSTRLAMTRSDEFGVLGRHFDAMAEELRDREFVRETFGRYVSKDVAAALLAEGSKPALGGEERIVTVMFTDLRDYTTISERFSPVQMVDMLNRYLGAMSEILDAHGGCVIEFLGDAILAVFGAPQYHADHAEQAVRCALAMRERLEGLNEEWEKTGLATLWRQNGVERLEARTGIHTGNVVAGNLGSKTRMKYAVIGDSVNVAARLETLNKELNTSIIMSEDVKTRLPPDLAALAADQGSFQVKGREQSVHVFAM